MNLKDKMLIYVYNKGNELESEKENLIMQRHYQIMDSLDMYENMRAEIRINAFNEFLGDIMNILLYCDTKKPQQSNNKR